MPRERIPAPRPKVPPTPKPHEARQVAYRAKALELAKTYGVAGAAKALGLSHAGFAAFLIGECRAATATYAIAQLDALGWTPEGYARGHVE